MERPLILVQDLTITKGTVSGSNYVTKVRTWYDAYLARWAIGSVSTLIASSRLRYLRCYFTVSSPTLNPSAMRNLISAFLPALALLALGGCAGTSAITSSEDDGVYYSSKDRTTAVVSAAPDPASTDEAANPDYNGNTAGSSARQGRGSDQYYDNTYTYMRGVPGPGLYDYMPYSPYTSLNYGWGAGAFGAPMYGGFYDPFYSSFYSPFYSPFGYGYGSGLSLSFGFGRPWGFGQGFGRPYGFGYGAGFYDPYYFNSPFYGGYYGRGAYYGNNYGYARNYGGNGNDNRPYRTSGHRSNRVSDGRYSSGVSPSNPAGPGTGPGGTRRGGRERTGDIVAPTTPIGGIVAPTTPTTEMTTAPNGGRRQRSERVTSAPPVEMTPAGTQGYNQPRRQLRGEQPVYRGDVNQPQGGEMQPQPAATTQPREGQRRREGFFQRVITEPTNPGGQTADQPTRERSYDQPRQRRSYEQPQQQRSYEQPRQQSYEQPQRSYSQPSNSQPSYSAPSNSGGGGRGRARD